MVGTRHQRNTAASQTADRHCRRIPYRICSDGGLGCFSINHQQSLQPQRFSANNSRGSLGALLSRGTAVEGYLDTGRLPELCEELGSSKMGQVSAGRNQDGTGRALATAGAEGGWDEGKNQSPYVCHVLARSSLGTLCVQSNFIRNTSGNRWEASAQYWRTRQHQTGEGTACFGARASQTSSDRSGIPRSAPGFH